MRKRRSRCCRKCRAPRPRGKPQPGCCPPLRPSRPTPMKEGISFRYWNAALATQPLHVASYSQRRRLSLRCERFSAHWSRTTRHVTYEQESQLRQIVGRFVEAVANRGASLPKIKLVKLIYLLDLEAYRERGYPITGL